MSSPDADPRSPSALPSSPRPTSVVTSSSSTEIPASSALADAAATRPNILDVRLSRQSFQDLLREVNHEVSERVISTLAPQIETVARISVGMQLGSPVRSNKRIYARFVAARSLQQVADSVVPVSGDESQTTSQELARLRSELHSAQAVQATAEASLTKKVMHRESAQMACSSARRELEKTQKEVHRLRAREGSVLQELDVFNADVDAHNELYQRLENRIKFAGDKSQQYTARQKEIFKAAVATSASLIRRLHQLLSISLSREAVSDMLASLSVDVESDAESTSTLVFASGDESENNTPAGPAAQSSVVQDVEAGEELAATGAGSSRDEFSVQGDAVDTVDHTAVVTGSTPVGSRGVSAVSASTSSAPTTTAHRPTPAPRRSSRGSTRVVATLSSTPGSDRQSLRSLVPLPSPFHGPQPLVRFSKQVVKWARPFMTQPFTLQGAFRCWTQILNYLLPTSVPPAT
ncbi:hypothetical protein PI125_g23429 [Phytophthora idaei]|nr:hypothetical protein PI125_g23429 [Phytophthora idaei]KAG3127681.1 hypothetical protein PI126_g21738 [Phytophthora idaei]